MSDNSSTENRFDLGDSAVSSINGIISHQEASTCSKENLDIVNRALKVRDRDIVTENTT